MAGETERTTRWLYVTQILLGLPLAIAGLIVHAIFLLLAFALVVVSTAWSMSLPCDHCRHAIAKHVPSYAVLLPWGSACPRRCRLCHCTSR